MTERSANARQGQPRVLEIDQQGSLESRWAGGCIRSNSTATGEVGAVSSFGGSVRRMGPSPGMPMTTAFELPGYRITENLGVCYGLVVRSMGLVGGVASSFKALRRGEVTQYTQLLEESRRHAIDRMVENASLMDAEGLIGVRFDSSEIGQQLTEIVAYGTAVKLAAE